MFNADSIIFNGKNTDDFGLIICHFDEVTCDTGLKKETIKSDRGMNRSCANYYGSKYSSGIELSFALAKEDGSAFTDDENITINEWLTENDTPTKLHVNNDSTVFINYYGVVIDIVDKIFSGRCAKEITFETDSPFAYEQILKKNISVENSKEITLINNGCEKYYYPTIKIIPTDNSVIIENKTDKNSVTFDLSNYSTGIIIDNEKNRITDIDGNLIPVYLLGFDDDYSSTVTSTTSTTTDIYWVRLLKGYNTLLITGSCTVTIECEFPRKAGSV